MRKTKIIKIDDLEITVKELRVKDIRKILSQAERADQDKKDKNFDINQIADVLPLAIDLSPDKINDFAPSELDLLWDAFKEVNAVFFSIIKKTGITAKLKSLISQHLTEAFADLSSADTDIPAS